MRPPLDRVRAALVVATPGDCLARPAPDGPVQGMSAKRVLRQTRAVRPAVCQESPDLCHGEADQVAGTVSAAPFDAAAAAMAARKAWASMARVMCRIQPV